MKIKVLILTAAVAVGLILVGGCGQKAPDASTSPAATDAAATAAPDASATPEATKAASTEPTGGPDAVSSATGQVASDDATLVKALGSSGSWIIIFNNDLTTTLDLVIEGSFTKADSADPKKMVPAGRKFALYKQDDKRVVTARFTLTAPKLTVKSENTKIQAGTFKGDVYVQAKGFTVVDGKVDGNVYFASEAIKASFVMGKGGSITGVQEIKQ